MQIYVRIKALGKRKDILPPAPYTIPDSVHSLRQLLTAFVETEVERYNRKGADTQLIPYLTGEQIEENAAVGKVGFGRLFSEKKADRDKAVQNAVQCWTDGLVRVFMEDRELSALDEELEIPEGAVFTLLRLSFLAGRMW